MRNPWTTRLQFQLKDIPLSEFDFHEACQVCHTKKNRRVEKRRSESRVTETFFPKTCCLKETKLFILMSNEITEYISSKEAFLLC